MQTTKNAKGTIAMTLTGHVSINDQNTMPMEFYDIPPQGEENTVGLVQNLANCSSNVSDTYVDEGDSLTVTLTAAQNYELLAANVQVTMGGVDITAMAYDNSTHKVTIAAVTSSVVINATATPSS